MKRIIIILVALMVSCGPSKEERQAKINGNVERDIAKPSQYETEAIEGCEYLTAGHVPNDWHVIAHKGNCKFCMKRNITIMDSIIRAVLNNKVYADTVIVIDSLMLRKLNAADWHLKMDTICSMSDKEIELKTAQIKSNLLKPKGK